MHASRPVAIERAAERQLHQREADEVGAGQQARGRPALRPSSALNVRRQRRRDAAQQRREEIGEREAQEQPHAPARARRSLRARSSAMPAGSSLEAQCRRRRCRPPAVDGAGAEHGHLVDPQAAREEDGVQRAPRRRRARAAGRPIESSRRADSASCRRTSNADAFGDASADVRDRGRLDSRRAPRSPPAGSRTAKWLAAKVVASGAAGHHLHPHAALPASGTSRRGARAGTGTAQRSASASTRTSRQSRAGEQAARPTSGGTRRIHRRAHRGLSGAHYGPGRCRHRPLPTIRA